MGRKFYVILKGKVDVLLKKEGMEDSIDSDPQTKKSVNAQTKIFGNTSISEEKDDEEENNNVERLPKIRSTTSPLKKTIIRPHKGALLVSPEEDSENFYKEHYPNLFKVRTLNAGDSFGEVALRQNVARYEYYYNQFAVFIFL